MRGKLLGIYLNDHLAFATAELALARRSRASNRGTPLSAFLESYATQVEQDIEEMTALLSRLGLQCDRRKLLAAWAAEKLGRLKLNGRLLGYSPLSRLVELEGLSLAAAARLSLWRSMEAVAEGEPRLAEVALASLAQRAEGQRGVLEEHRRQAVFDALSEP